MDGGLPLPPPPQETCNATIANRTAQARANPIFLRGDLLLASKAQNAVVAANPSQSAGTRIGVRGLDGSGNTAEEAVVEIVIIEVAEDEPRLTGFGANMHELFAGRPAQESAIAPAVLPGCGVNVTVEVADPPAFIVGGFKGVALAA